MISRFNRMTMTWSLIKVFSVPNLMCSKATCSANAGFGCRGGSLRSSQSLFPTFATNLSSCTSVSTRNYGCSLYVSTPHHSVPVASVQPSKALEVDDEEIDEEDDDEEDDGEDEEKEDEAEGEEGEVRSQFPAIPQRKIVPASARGFQVLGNKEKKQLRAYAHGLGTRLNVQQVGKLGVSQTVVNSISDALEANEILKVKVLENCPSDMEEVVQQLELGTEGQLVGKVGRTLLLYRASLRKLAASENESGKLLSERPKSRGRKTSRNSSRVQTGNR